MEHKCCETCYWVHRFEPREDERRMGLVLGCKKPGYEGYTSPLRMSCDGVFWQKSDEELRNDELFEEPSL